ncbi:MAG: hypothetical protein DK306_001857 [Chloroflexi bacterium]|nr:MAG: hypothetical protein DK306_001857 [Chloroflexota bacterium]
MLRRTDRLALAVPDRHVAAEAFAQLYDAAPVDDAMDPVFNAHRLTLGWGQDQLELLEPAGDGPVQAFLAENRRGIFAGGVAADDPAAVAAGMQTMGVRVQADGPDRFAVTPQDGNGVAIIISKHAEREIVGLDTKLWQITYAVPDLEPAIAHYLPLLGMDAMYTYRYASERFGYDGAITWFDSARDGLLDSLEYLDANDPEKAVARFLAKVGQGIYMASIETGPGALDELRTRVTSTGPGWDGSTDDILGFIHPLRQHGLLLAAVDSAAWHERRLLPGDPESAPH